MINQMFDTEILLFIFLRSMKLMANNFHTSYKTQISLFWLMSGGRHESLLEYFSSDNCSKLWHASICLLRLPILPDIADPRIINIKFHEIKTCDCILTLLATLVCMSGISLKCGLMSRLF